MSRYRKWLITRNEILARDNFACTKCGRKDRLEVHHKDGSGDNWHQQSDFVNNDKNNLVTLCRTCHSKGHWQQAREAGVANLFELHIPAERRVHPDTAFLRKYQGGLS